MEPTPCPASPPPREFSVTVKPHQLELFYYVARHGGISAATRHIPYGLGQPAVSGQMSDLERRLGRRLFERRPFRLTDAGRRLYAHVEQFFSGLDPLWRELQATPARSVRIGIDETLGPEFPAVLLSGVPSRVGSPIHEFHTGPPGELLAWLRERHVHLVITAADRRPAGVRAEFLGHATPHLLVERKSGIKSARHFWRQERIAEPLIWPMEAGAIHSSFARGLRALHVDWPASIRVDSTAAMRQLVASGHGVGVGLAFLSAPHPRIRSLPLAGFAAVSLLALWRPPAEPWMDAYVAAAKRAAGRSPTLRLI